MAKRKSKYYAYGFEQGKQAAHDTDWQPNEMQNAYDNDTLGEIAGDILDNYRQYAGTVYYQGLTNNQLDKYEDGFFAGFQSEVEKILKQKKILNPRKKKNPNLQAIRKMKRTAGKGYKHRPVFYSKTKYALGTRPQKRVLNPDVFDSAADPTAAYDLYLYIENDGDLYRQQGQPILKNLITKMARGIYDHTKAIKLYMYLVENGAKKYAKDFQINMQWHELFPIKDRKIIAEQFVNNFESEAALGNYDNFLPKKYQKKISNPGRKKKPIIIKPIGRNIDEISGNYVDEMNKIDPKRANTFDRGLSDMLGSGVSPNLVWQYAEQEIRLAKKYQKKTQNPRERIKLPKHRKLIIEGLNAAARGDRKKAKRLMDQARIASEKFYSVPRDPETGRIIKIQNPNNSTVKDYAAFARKDKVKVSTINIPAIKQLIEIGDAFGVLYKSDKFSKGNPKFYEHRLKKHGKIYLVNTTKNAAAILMTGLKINMKPEGLVG